VIRFEHTYGGKDQVTMTVSDDDATLTDVLEAFKKFCLAIGYMPETVASAFKEMAEEE
jgi:hypothetical protein